jgi:MYXO-CTERM domain-containing protein
MFTARITLAAALIASAGFATTASAQVRSWNFGDTTNPGACTGTFASFGNTIGCSQQPNGATVNLNVNAFSTTGSGGAYQTAAVNYQGTGSGFGVGNQVEGAGVTGSPDHSMDNNGTGIDMLLLNFTGIGSQILKSVTLGWSGADADFQVLRWAGAGAATAVANRTSAQLLSDGWQLVSLVNGVGGISTPDVSYSVNGTNLSSSSWLITAYNSAFGGSGSTTGIDAIKVLGVTTGIAVSSPGTLVLSALALAGLAVVRRRNA